LEIKTNQVMNIPASQLLNHLSPDVLSVKIRTMYGHSCPDLPYESLKVLVARNCVTGLATARGKLRQIRLTVTTDKAFSEIEGSTSATHNALHADANVTTERSSLNEPPVRKKHHKKHTRSWNDSRVVPAAFEPRGLREKTLRSMANDVAVAYRDLHYSRDQIYSQFGIGWNELDWIMRLMKVELRRQRTGTAHAECAPGSNTPFLPYAEGERDALFRRVWGSGWPTTCIARAF